MAGKKLLNDAEQVVDEALEGLVASHPGLHLNKKHRLLYRPPISTNVSLLSGGGSGHEPSHSGFISPGMLTGTVSGSIFASPPASAIHAGIRTLCTDKGVLCIVKNYTGDRIQFGKAVERARREGMRTEMVVVGEDCAIGRDRVGRAGRRGLAGTLFVHKIAGATARRGASLEQVCQRAQHVADNIGTVGVALTPCTIPGATEPAFQMGSNEMEFGLGIHGEAGIQRVTILSARDTARKCLDMILSTEADRGYLPVDGGERVALLVNNLGGMTALEIHILVRDALAYLHSKSISVPRVYSGTLMTSLDMSGVSFTLLRLAPGSGILEDLDEEVECAAWPRVFGQWDSGKPHIDEEKEEEGEMAWRVQTDKGLTLLRILRTISADLISSTSTLNTYDRVTGDGDCGTTVSNGARAILECIGEPDQWKISHVGLPADDLSKAVARLSVILERAMGGSFGGVVCLFLEALSTSLSAGTPVHISLQTANRTLITHLSTALGDRTLVDALQPSIEVYAASVEAGQSVPEAVQRAAEAAKKGMEATSEMDIARAGRSANVGIGLKGTPDPGAWAIWRVWESVKHVTTR
ncbi:hypothetical protein SpCBS45565_g01687 [Spizellomyces sp. 'palustris']|nr:hypothetical protein SpCBS45565_g01687 [Spizellomyces sp. 'palustris']